ncbi:hypothetical protein D3C74_49160 [compost metagenome]
MRFKVEQNGINFFLSDREVQNYDEGRKLTTDNNLIEDEDMGFKLGDEDAKLIRINGQPILIKSRVQNTSAGSIADIEANGYPFRFSKIMEITKYDLFRYLVRHFKRIVPNEERVEN